MKTSRLTIVLRSALGLIFVAGPLASAMRLAPEPQLPPGAAAFTGALAATGYMLPLLWSAEIAGGVLLLTGLLVPFALVLLAPVIVNIVAFHLFLAPSAMPTAIVVSVLEIYMAWQYRAAFGPLFRTAAAQPAAETGKFRVQAA
ncbi:MAG TPA: hypothetical protein VGH29_11905 [Candidatus Binataceae bacterium]